MTTLLHLSQTIVDMQQELAREQRFANDACHNLLRGITLVREAIDALEKDIRVSFEERDRSVSRVIGNSAPFTTTIEMETIAKLNVESTKAAKLSAKKNDTEPTPVAAE